MAATISSLGIRALVWKGTLLHANPSGHCEGCGTSAMTHLLNRAGEGGVRCGMQCNGGTRMVVCCGDGACTAISLNPGACLEYRTMEGMSQMKVPRAMLHSAGDFFSVTPDA